MAVETSEGSNAPLDCPDAVLVASWRTYTDAELVAGALNLCRWVVQDAEAGLVAHMTPYHARGVRAFINLMAERIGEEGMAKAQASILAKPAVPFVSEEEGK